MKKIKLNRENGIQIGGKIFISLLKAIQITSKVLKEKIDYNTHVTLDKSVPAHLSDENNDIHNTITQIIVDSFDEFEWSMNTNGNVEIKKIK